MTQTRNKKNSKFLVVLTIIFSALTWIILLPAFYVRNLWLLPLHEMTAWAEQQVNIFGGLGLQVDVFLFRRYASMFSFLAPCASLVSSLLSILVGVWAYRVRRSQDYAPQVSRLLATGLASGILGVSTTVVLFGVSLYYLTLYLLLYRQGNLY